MDAIRLALAPDERLLLAPGSRSGTRRCHTAAARCSLSKTSAVVRRCKIEQGPDGHDTSRVYLPLAAVIVSFDLIDAHRAGNSRHLIKLAKITPHIGIVGDAAQVAFEMAVVDRVEANERREQPPIRLGDLVAHQIALT